MDPQRQQQAQHGGGSVFGGNTSQVQHQPIAAAPASRPSVRPRSKSGFSFRSDKSGDSKSHKRKESLIESSAEKRKHHLSAMTKANPNAAMHEAQPIAAALEKSTLVGLHNIHCNDVWGNPIAEPDKSNPTRSTSERPLDTIKGFDFAIEKAFRERISYIEGPGAPQYGSRRASSVWQGRNGPNGQEGPPRFSQYSGQHPNGSGYFHNGPPANRDSYGDSSHGPPPPAGGRHHHPSAYQSDPRLNRYPGGGHHQGGGVYPSHPPHHARSRDTLNTGASSGSEQWRGEASDGESLEKAKGVIKPNGGYQNGLPVGPQSQQHGYPNGPPPGYQNGGPNTQGGYSNGHTARAGSYAADYRNGNGQQQQRPPGAPPQNGNGYYNGPPGEKPLPPPASQKPAPISLNAPVVPTGAVQPPPKRQSWLKRRFSKN